MKKSSLLNNATKQPLVLIYICFSGAFWDLTVVCPSILSDLCDSSGLIYNSLSPDLGALRSCTDKFWDHSGQVIWQSAQHEPMTVLKSWCTFFLGLHTRHSHPYAIHTNLSFSFKILYILLESNYKCLLNIALLQHIHSVKIAR